MYPHITVEQFINAGDIALWGEEAAIAETEPKLLDRYDAVVGDISEDSRRPASLLSRMSGALNALLA